MSYGWTGIDLLGWGLTLLGLVGLVWLWRAGPVVMPASEPTDEPVPPPPSPLALSSAPLAKSAERPSWPGEASSQSPGHSP